MGQPSVNQVTGLSTLPLHEKMRNTLRYGVANFLLILSIFLYVSPLSLGFDTQPFALLFSFVVVVESMLRTKILKIPGPIMIFLLMFFVSIIFMVFSADKFIAMRSLAGYATLFFVTLASYQTFGSVKVKWFNFCVYLYLVVGLAQLTVDKRFGEFLLPRMSTSTERGITSLAVEPSAYAVVCIFMLMINDILLATGKQTKKKYLIITVLLVAQILITLSGIGLVFFTVYLFSKVISILIKDGISRHLSKIVMFMVVLTAIFIAFRTVDSLQQSRGGLVLDQALEDPRTLLIQDGSIADRLTHAILPIYSLFYSHGAGLGLGTWSQYAIHLRSYAGGFVELMGKYATLGADRIMSGWGTAMYELGAIGLLYMISYLKIVRNGFKLPNKTVSMAVVSSGLTIWLMMFMAIPLAFPLFSYMMGMFLYCNKTYRNSEKPLD